MAEVIYFPGTKEFALQASEGQNGVVITDNDNGRGGVQIEYIGAPNRALLLWMSEQLRVAALFGDADEEQADEIS